MYVFMCVCIYIYRCITHIIAVTATPGQRDPAFSDGRRVGREGGGRECRDFRVKA